MEGTAFLQKGSKVATQPVYALYGEEDFLRRRCREAILKRILRDEDPSFALSVYSGETLDFSTIRNELDTPPFLGPARIVAIEDADSFISEHRAALEKYVASPSKIGVLILEARTFPETTKLAKALPDEAKIVCKTPSPAKLAEWCGSWCKSHHGKAITPDAAELLVELVGAGMGQLDQELEKLAMTAGTKDKITPDEVAAMVGRTRSANVFHILDAIGDGRPAVAMSLLADLLDDGEEPLAILAPLTSQLRKLATVGRHVSHGLSFGPAMDAAGVPKWAQARQSAERQLRRLGRERVAKIPEWLVEINLGLKGGSPLPPRLQLERFLVRLAK